MKRLMFLSITLALMLVFVAPHHASAQIHLDDLLEGDSELGDNDTVPAQRIGIPSTEIQLTSNGTGSVGGYCFDEYLIAPRRTTVFEHVLAGNSATVATPNGIMPLVRAIERGDVDVRARQLQVTFVNRTDAPMKITMPEPVVLWERPGGAVNPDALAVLAQPASYSERQARIWKVTTAERNLHMLGYYPNSEWRYDRDKLHDAIAAYQRDNGMQPTGRIDRMMLRSMSIQVEEIGSRLARLGYRDREGRSLRTDVAAIIRDFERAQGRHGTGIWTNSLADRLKVDEQATSQIAALRTARGSIDATLEREPSNVLTYLSSLNGFMALVQTPDGLELWNQGRTLTRGLAAGREAVEAIDQAAVNLAARVNRDDRLVIYPRVSAGETTMVVVGSSEVDVPSAELVAYLDGGAIPDALSAVLAPMVPSSGHLTGGNDAPTLILYRGPLAQGRAPAALADLGLSQIDATRLADALDRTYGSRIELYTSDDLRHGATRHSGGLGWLFANPPAMYAAR